MHISLGRFTAGPKEPLTTAQGQRSEVRALTT
jgi:hypothetical protein